MHAASFTPRVRVGVRVSVRVKARIRARVKVRVRVMVMNRVRVRVRSHLDGVRLRLVLENRPKLPLEWVHGPESRV